jgi:pyruvate,water dikinase
VAANELGGTIEAALADAGAGDVAAWEAASTTIRQAFRVGTMPTDVLEPLLHEARSWDRTPLAVRSSATAEDLPDLSFAGQQDTFLNVVGPDALVAAVVDCWSSLWTARAIGYRARAGIAPDEVALAVIIQRLVSAQVSGVLFTANPLTGQRGQTVIDATYGLGEALVSGQVEPDHVVADRASGAVVAYTTGAKATRTITRPSGGVETVAAPEQATSERAPSERCLTEEQVKALVALGNRVQQVYGQPQDLEWAIADGTLYLLQARAVTSLFPLPEPVTGKSDGKLAVWFSVGAFQGMLQPMTPLGLDTLKTMMTGAATLFGFHFGPQGSPALAYAAERPWVRIDGLLRNPMGRRIVPKVFPMVEPGSLETLEQLLGDPRLAEDQSLGRRRVVRRMGPFLLAALPRIVVALASPAGYRRHFERAAAAAVEDARRESVAADRIADPRERLAARLQAARRALGVAFPMLLPRFAPIMASSMMLTFRLGSLAASVDAKSLSREALRSLPGNPTTQMDLALWAAAVVIRGDKASRARFERDDVETLTAAYRAGTLPAAAEKAIAGFLNRYGMRGVGEIDLGAARWREEPGDIIGTVKAYVALDNPAAAPDVVFRRGISAAREATDRLARLLDDGTLGGRARARQARLAVSRIRAMFGARETPKFTIVRIFGLIREGLLASGADLVAAGQLGHADDIFFLRMAELDAIWDQAAGEVDKLVRGRRAVYAREAGRRQVPRMILSDGETFYHGVAHGVPEGAIVGSPVSGGVVQGRVRVVFNPQHAGLQQGEILVCPGTDPAWTPLFLTAGGLVTEVGGMMTHGSVVAREYGIPAVVGVHAATTRLVTGQSVRLDGTSGVIELLEPESHADSAATHP